jgi:DNA primase
VVFCFDGDNAGRKAAWRALESTLPTLKEGVGANFVFLPDGHDPDSLVKAEGTEAFNQRLREGLSLADFLFNHLSIDLRLDSLEGKSRLASLAKPFIEKVPVGVYRQLLWQRLSQLTGLDEQALKSAMPLAAPTVTPNTNYETAKTTPTSQPKRHYQTMSNPPKLRSLAGRSSLSDKAIQLLLQKPDAVLHLELTHIPLNGETDLLLEIIKFCQAQPDSTSISILGAWQGTEEGQHLQALAEDTAFIPALNVEEELHDILNQLKVHQLNALLQQPSLGLAETMRLKKELKALITTLAKKPQ